MIPVMWNFFIFSLLWIIKLRELFSGKLFGVNELSKTLRKMS